jgi:hypothetical protein
VTTLARAVFVLLVGATFAAFFAAQRIKGEPAVAQVVSLARVFSPNGDGRKEVNRFEVELRERSEISVDVVDSAGESVRRLRESATVSPSRPLRLEWDGRTDDGDRVPDGRYRVRVTLRREGRSVIVPRTTLVDTRAPRPRVKRITPGPIVGPEAVPVQIEVGSVSRRLIKRGRVYRTDDGAPRVVAELGPVTDSRTLVWDGRTEDGPAPPGNYLVEVTARDRAANLGTAPREIPPPTRQIRGRPGLTIRALAAEAPLRPVTAGRRLRVNVDARRRPYRWRLRRVGRTKPVLNGRAGPGKPVELTAPSGDSGLYALELFAGGHKTAVPVMVQSRERAVMLVVIPALTWAATVQEDQDADGLADTLEAGDPVSWPRVFEDGLPDDLYERVAPLLAALDRARIRYDITSDLDLALNRTGAPRATDRKAVMLVGSQRWITRSYGRRLRRYVLDGGRLASFGTESLRRGVAVQRNRDGTAGRLVRPTEPAVQDPFGTRFEDVRTTSSPVILSLIEGDPADDLLEGFDGALGGFSVLEESEARGDLLAALGVETAVEETPDVPDELPEAPKPVLESMRVGEGQVIYVGLPQWAQRLGEDRQVWQITRNIVDILRGSEPRIRSLPPAS